VVLRPGHRDGAIALGLLERRELIRLLGHGVEADREQDGEDGEGGDQALAIDESGHRIALLVIGDDGRREDGIMAML
jgi:hypothetical protein